MAGLWSKPLSRDRLSPPQFHNITYFESSFGFKTQNSSPILDSEIRIPKSEIRSWGDKTGKNQLFSSGCKYEAGDSLDIPVAGAARRGLTRPTTAGWRWIFSIAGSTSEFGLNSTFNLSSPGHRRQSKIFKHQHPEKHQAKSTKRWAMNSRRRLLRNQDGEEAGG